MTAPATDASDSLTVIVRPAQTGDLPGIDALIAPYVEEKRLLPRTPDELEELIGKGYVAIVDGEVVGFAALDVYSAKLAEIRSLAVAPHMQRHGIGKRLVDACVNRARDRGIFEVMAITSSELFFRNCGFDFTLPGEKKALFLQTRDEH